MAEVPDFCVFPDRYIVIKVRGFVNEEVRLMVDG
jgi:hypothetical protein